ncbi:hypothetical protein NUW58_g8370 [Xylaria curta]|uniref:Uncharacterized protein n=1 Tax=Xylaria curta TaxID=42375 RepID=A0ACC1NA68_9PEZI|nr:hypothetical protein NUW58_g8370 [Xylaria curta]
MARVSWPPSLGNAKIQGVMELAVKTVQAQQARCHAFVVHSPLISHNGEREFAIPFLFFLRYGREGVPVPLKFNGGPLCYLDHGVMAHLKAFNPFTKSNNRFSGLRLGPIVAAVLFTLILFYTTEFRRRSWSCKTWATCFGGRPHNYKHWDDVDPELRVDSFEKTLHDGTVFFHRQTVENTKTTSRRGATSTTSWIWSSLPTWISPTSRWV